MGSREGSSSVHPARMALTMQVLFNEFEKVLTPQAGESVSKGRRLSERLAQDELALTRRFGRQFQDLERQLNERAIMNDPMARALRAGAMRTIGVATQGLDDILSGNLPSDFERNLTQDVRASQAARGIIDSGAAGVEEAARLMGGREAIRAQRLGQAQAILGGGQQLSNVPALRRFRPMGFTELGVPTGGVLPTLGRMESAAGAQRISMGNQIIGTTGQVYGGLGQAFLGKFG